MAVTHTKNDIENLKRGYEFQIKGSYPVEKLQMSRGHIESNEKINSQVSMKKEPKETQEE